MWTQIVGKIRTKLHPPVNHWWHSAYYITPRGLTTGPIPCQGRFFQIDLDFIDHVLIIETSADEKRFMALAPKSVARFYSELMELLDSLRIHLHINPVPQEVPDPIPFDQDEVHASYERDKVRRVFDYVLQADHQLKMFRSRFIGKCSPVHFFWGSFDLAFSVFSGRLAPERPGVDAITREGYSHEVMSWGFWPGSGKILAPAYYAYCAPEPQGYQNGAVLPRNAFYSPVTHGYLLMLEQVHRSPKPDEIVLDFCGSTYELGAELGNWDRSQVERAPALKRAA
jgi:hypothetical protein